MGFIDLAKRRFSCRLYLNRQVDDDKVKKILEAACVAPSAANKQPWEFYVFKSQENKQKIYNLYKRDWILLAPVIIVACSDKETAWKRADGKVFADVDVAIAIDHITLAATDLGLATCWVCNFDQKKLKESLKLPEILEPLALIPLGYPGEDGDPDRHEKARKPPSSMIHWENL